MSRKKIIMNEENEVFSLLNDGLKNKDLYQSLDLLSRYYLVELKYDKFQIYNNLEIFLKSNVIDYNKCDYTQILEYFSENNNTRKLTKVKSIKLYTSELNIIEGLKDKKLEKIAFVLLVISKFNHQVNPNNKYWCNLSLAEINELSKIHSSISNLCHFLNQLYSLGLIDYNKKMLKNNIQVKYYNKGCKFVAMEIKTFENLIYEYLNYRNPHIFIRNNNGVLHKINKK